MKKTLLTVAWLCAMPCAVAADQTSPARAVFAESCLQLATLMSLQGDAQKRFVDECVRAKENVNNPGTPAAPFEPNPAC